MTNLSVIILVGKEERHIGRCLEKLAPIEPRQIFVVESQKGDRTHEVAAETAKGLGISEQGVGVGSPAFCTVWHDWEGTQAKQFNWAVDLVEGKSKSEEGKSVEDQPSSWILRLDADEYLTDESINWLKENLGSIPSDVNALEFTLERKFCGGVIRHGTNGIKMVRMFRRGHGRYAETVMDERIEFDGKVQSAPVVFYDDNLNSMDWWREKHRGYAKREAQQAVESLKSGIWVDPRKAKYYKLPPYLRAFAYFCVRYFLKGGILDGYAGWMWNFWQGLWYRCLVDYEIGKMKRS